MADNTKSRPGNREHQRDAESSRQLRSARQQHANQACVSLGVFKELHCRSTYQLIQKLNRELGSGTIRGKTPTGREAQPSGSATHQLFKCCSFGKEGRVSREELEEGPVRHQQTRREDSPRDMKGCKKKYKDIYWEFGETGRGDWLSMGQRLER